MSDLQLEAMKSRMRAEGQLLEKGGEKGERIEDAFVGKFLTKEGESVEDAKKRLTRIVQDQADEIANDESRGEEYTDSSSDKDA